MIDLILRCETRARWLTFAQNRGIIVITNNVEVIQPGFSVDEVGNVVLTPAVYDNTVFPPVLVTPETRDTWWTVQVRLSGAQEDNDADNVYAGESGDTSGFKFVKSKVVAFIRNQSTPVTLRGMRAYQFGAVGSRIQLIDPRDIHMNPLGRIWAGGMEY